jgi:alpha-tubulin suppressor-like RCC1 family protein
MLGFLAISVVRRFVRYWRIRVGREAEFREGIRAVPVPGNGTVGKRGRAVIRRMSPARLALRRGRAWPGATRHVVLRPLRRGAVAVAVAVLVACVCVAVQLVAPAPASAAATVPAAAGSWPFSEGSGTTTADSSGNGHTGTLGTGVTWAAPEVGAHSIALPGTAAGAVTITGAVVNTAASYTASAWVNLNSIAAGGVYQTFVSISGLASPTGTTVSGMYLTYDEANDHFALAARASDSGTATITQALSTTAAQVGVWYHLVGVYSLAAQTLSLYVNGALQATTAFTTPWQATGNTMIGQDMYNGTPADFVGGKIDDVALYSSALTAAQVAALNPPAIATGLTTSCEIRSGNAYCWGDNSTGTLGDNSIANSSVPVAVYTGGALAGLTLTQISVGSDFACALSSAGSAYCWGVNSSGQLGNGTTVSSNAPVLVSGGLTFTQIDTGATFACALTNAGAAWCWGNDGQDQLGNTTLATNSDVPVAVTGGLAFAQISLGTSFACALTTAVPPVPYCWGSDSAGQIGNAAAANPQTAPLAVTTSGVLSGLTLTQISAALGGSTACALSSAGAAYCWGLGTNGELGNGSTTAAQATAVAVTTSGVLSGVTLTQISGGQDQTCALGSTGVAYCWGGNGSGDLGINSTTQSLVPAAVSTSGVLSGKVLTQISASGNFISCALDSFGAAYCWGLNSLGQAGKPDTAVNFLVPATVMSQATMIATGYNHSCLLRNGKAYCWGDDTYGELGNNTTTTTPQSTQVPVYTGGVLSGLTLVQISAGQDWTCALASTGNVYCWGNNSTAVSGDVVALGNGTSTASSVPVLVSGGLFFTQISVGSDFACGLTSAGVAYCWGNNHSGQLGNGFVLPSSVPGAVTATILTPLFGLTLTQIAAGSSYACALASTGAAYCWGLGTSGQLGTSASASSSTPVAVTVSGVLSGVALVQITTGGTSTCALGSAGVAYCWGAGGSGQLGNGSTTAIQNTAVAVTATSTGMPLAQITAGTSFACAVDVTGAAWCWGLGTPGDQLGNNLNASSSTPVAVTATGVLAGVTLFQISSGQLATCAQDTTGAFYCWGTNANGQLGNASTTSSDVPVLVQGIAPGPPTGVTATPGNTTATISWTAPASLGTGTLTGYTATATAVSGTFTCTTTSAVTCVITGLTDGTTYSVTVVTLTTDGNSPPSSPAVNVEPVGFLQLTSPTSLTWAATGTGLNQAAVDGNSSDQQLTATDNTATGAGWHITVSATTFTTGPKSLPNTGAVDFTGSAGSSVASTAPTATCVGSCTLPTNTTTYPVVMATAVSSPTVYTVYDTAVSTGEGVMTIGGSSAANPIGWWVQVPAAAYAGVYASTVTLEVVSGP